MTTITVRYGESLYTFPISPDNKAYVLRAHRSRRRVYKRAEGRRESERSIMFIVAANAPGADSRPLTVGLHR